MKKKRMTEAIREAIFYDFLSNVDTNELMKKYSFSKDVILTTISKMMKKKKMCIHSDDIHPSFVQKYGLDKWNEIKNLHDLEEFRKEHGDKYMIVTDDFEENFKIIKIK